MTYTLPPAEDVLAIVRLVEQDMAEQALKARRAADARHGLSDHGALIIHADALTRWSERLRMALSGEDYRDRSIPPAGCVGDTPRTTRFGSLGDCGERLAEHVCEDPLVRAADRATPSGSGSTD